MPTEFKKPGLLVVEGMDEWNFFGKLLEYMGVTGIVDIKNTEGISNYKKYIPTIRYGTGFPLIEKIAVTRDADENAGDAFRSVTGILIKAGFKPPERPGEFSNGRPAMRLEV